MRESDTVEQARRALGAELAAYRRAAGYSQAEFASVVGYSRSTVANVETGRQHVPRGFWIAADEALRAGNALIGTNDEINNAVRREREEAARRAHPSVIAITRNEGAGSARPLHMPEGATGAPDPLGGRLDLIAVAAGQARDHAAQAAVTEVGPATVEQLTADIVRLGRAYVCSPPLPLFAAMHGALGRTQAALDQRTYPAQARDLNFLAGALCGLMANASLDLRREEAADDLARAAWTYGQIIDHGPLMGWARGTQALAAIWDERYADAIQHAEEGLSHTPAGNGAVRLSAILARALAARGDYAQARGAMTAAQRSRVNTRGDELHDGIAGEFTFDDAKLHYYDALTLNDAPDPDAAERAAAAAISLYQAVPARARSYGCDALARVQLARAQLMRKNLEDAAQALAGVLALDPQMRIGSLTQHLEACRQLLSEPAFRTAATARQLDQQLAAFSSATTAQALPGGR